MTKSEHRVSVSEGKYTFVVPADDYRVSILRYGEPLHGPQGEASNALHAIMYELDAARVVVQAFRDLVAPGNDRLSTREGFNRITDALALHDRLTSDREPPSAWCGVERPAATDWVPPSHRVPEPGPCTPMAHNWVSGSAVCQCGEATREGDCTGWKTASRLTGDQIYEAVTGQKKPTTTPATTTATTDDALDREIQMMEAEGNLGERWQRGLAWLRELRERRAAVLDEKLAQARDRIRELESIPPSTEVARTVDTWTEEDGNVLWWKFPIVEPPYCGTPLDEDFPRGYHTHWTPIAVPVAPGVAPQDPDPSATKHWPDCAVNHGGTECDMGPECGTPASEVK